MQVRKPWRRQQPKHHIRSRRSASIWSAPDGSGLLTLDASSVQTDPDGSRRIAWMINRMINDPRQSVGRQCKESRRSQAAYARCASDG